MFKYDEFPILKREVYNSKGILHHKTLRLKSHKPYIETPNYTLTNVIDFETGQHLTLKTLNKTKSLAKDKILAEIGNQEKLATHPNFIQIDQVYQDHECIYIFMEENFASLQEVVEKRAILFQREVQYIFCQLVTILQNLRTHNIFHGGICLRNLYLDTHTMKIKLSGFGHSIAMQKVKKGAHTNLYSETQLTPYTAPELMDNSIENPLMYYGGDIWSVGVVIYTLLVGEEPFTNYDRDKKLRTPSITKLKNFMYQFPMADTGLGQCQPKIKVSLTKTWKELLKQIFTAKQTRISLDKLIKHELNNITESKFLQITGQHIPTVKNHAICREDVNFRLLNFEGTVKRMFGDGDGVGRKTGSLDPPPRLHYATASHYQPPKQQDSPKQVLTGAELNTCILKICLQQQLCPYPLPLLSQPPPCIQKYCYMQAHKCLGYIFENKIGVVYEDGSCVMGQTDNKYLYIHNQGQGCGDISGLMATYMEIYDEFCGGGAHVGTTVSDSDYINESSCKNLFGAAKGSTNKQIGGNFINNMGSKLQNSSINSNLTVSKLYSQGQNSQKIKKSKMYEISSSSSPSPTASNSKIPFGNTSGQLKNQNQFLKSTSINQDEYFTASNNNDKNFAKFGQSFLCQSSMNNNNTNTNGGQQISMPKYEIYKYFVSYFGERVIDVGREEWVIGFWRIGCGIVMLFSSGVWQINLNQGISKIQKSGRDGGDRKQVRNQAQCAILIDRYGLAWWLKSEKKSANRLHDRYHCSNYCDNNGYSSLCVKIGRKLVSQIRGRYIKQFENMMQPYKYANL